MDMEDEEESGLNVFPQDDSSSATIATASEALDIFTSGAFKPSHVNIMPSVEEEEDDDEVSEVLRRMSEAPRPVRPSQSVTSGDPTIPTPMHGRQSTMKMTQGQIDPATPSLSRPSRLAPPPMESTRASQVFRTDSRTSVSRADSSAPISPIPTVSSLLDDALGSDLANTMAMYSTGDQVPEAPSPFSKTLAKKLRQYAQQADQEAFRYVSIVEESGKLVSDIKSALYDADHSGQPRGAEVLLDEVGNMLSEASTQSMAEASRLQPAAEQWLNYRKRMVPYLQQNHASLEDLARRRSEFTRKRNEEDRAECDRLWKQVKECEAELQHMPKWRSRKPTPGNEASDADRSTPHGGLTLDGAHTLLRAFAAVLQPHRESLACRDVRKRTPAESVAMEFLGACVDSKKSRAPKMKVPLARCNSADAVFHGDAVETDKTRGLLPLPMLLPGDDDADDEDVDLTPLLSPGFADEAQTLLQQLGGI